MRRIYLFIFVFLLSIHNSFADEPVNNQPDSTKWWLNVGFIGKTFGENTQGNGSVSGISVENSAGIFTLRNSYYEDGPDIFDCIFEAIFFSGCDEDITTIEEWALLYGRNILNDEVYVSTGIGNVTGKGPKADNLKFSTVGIPFEIHFHRNRWKHAGAGIMVEGNVNDKESFVGLYITFQFGKLE